MGNKPSSPVEDSYHNSINYGSFLPQTSAPALQGRMDSSSQSLLSPAPRKKWSRGEKACCFFTGAAVATACIVPPAVAGATGNACLAGIFGGTDLLALTLSPLVYLCRR